MAEQHQPDSSAAVVGPGTGDMLDKCKSPSMTTETCDIPREAGRKDNENHIQDNQEQKQEKAASASDVIKEEGKAAALLNDDDDDDDKNGGDDNVNDSAVATSNDDRSTTSTTTSNDRTWDHTNRKVMVYNVLKYVRPKEVDKLVSSWFADLSQEQRDKIKIVKAKKPPTANWIQVTLENEDMVQPFIEVINDGRKKNRRGKPLFASRADSKFDRRDNASDNDDRTDDKRGGKRKNRDNDEDCQSGEEGNKKVRRDKFDDEETVTLPKTADEVRDVITPLWRMPYEKQIERKWREMVKKCAMKICQEIKAKFRTLEKEARRNKHRKRVVIYDWLKEHRPIEVEKVIPSPSDVEYRNKCEFTFGYHHEVVASAAASATAKETDDGKTKDTASEAEGETPVSISKTPGVGFCASGWSGGVSRPHCCQNIPSEACGIADIVDEFLRTSPIPPYDSRVHRGVWRTLTIRLSKRTGQYMVVIIHAPPKGGVGAKDDGTDDYSDCFNHEKERLVQMLTESSIPIPKRDFPVLPTDNADVVIGKSASEACNGEGENQNSETGEGNTDVPDESAPSVGNQPMRVTSIFFQEYEGLSMPKAEHPVQHAYGKKVIEEKLGKCCFQISPGAFFQVNTEGAEVLYNLVVEKVREVTSNPDDTLLFDVCCGTGTIGLTCMKEGVVGRVVGVDISQPAIEDAKCNSARNGWTEEENVTDPADGGDDVDKACNGVCRFVTEKAEVVLGKELGKVRTRPVPIVAVVDPAREGLHSDVVRTLRTNEKIQRLIYVSCNPTASLVRDAALLCSPPTKRYPGLPFKPTSAQPVDMFPLTSHCEMVMTFDRMSTHECDGDE